MSAAHRELEDEITEAAGKLAAAAMTLARKTGQSYLWARDEIAAEAGRMLNNIKTTRHLQSRKHGDPQAETQKCALAPTTTTKVQ